MGSFSALGEISHIGSLMGLGRGTSLPGEKGKCRQVHPSWLIYTFPFLQENKEE